MAHVLALIHEEDGVFGISFPDFPGCVSTATSLDDVIARGAMAVAFHVEGMVEDGEALPMLRSADDIRRMEEVEGAIIAAVSVDLPGKSVRVQITMDEHLLAAFARPSQPDGRFTAHRPAFVSQAGRSDHISIKNRAKRATE